MSDPTSEGGGPRGAELDDPESPDAAPPPTLDLSPATGRHADSGTASRARSRNVAAFVLLALVVGGLAVVLLNGLNDAATFFYNVDEAVERRPELDGDRFRMQGNVVPGSVESTAEGVRFTIRFGGAEVGVDHVGDPPELFGPRIPVVLEGSFDGERFASDQILIRHDSSYDEENPDRVREAERDAGRASGGAG